VDVGRGGVMWAVGALGLLALALVGAVFWLATWLDRTAMPEEPPPMTPSASAPPTPRPTRGGRRDVMDDAGAPRRRTGIEWMILAEDRAVLGRVVAATLPEALAAGRARWGPLCRRAQSRVSWEITQDEARTIRRDRVIRE